MEDTGGGKASPKVERLCALLDPRRKALGADQLVNGSAALRTRAKEDLKGLIVDFAGAQTRLCWRQCWMWSPRNLPPRRRGFRD
ncbi:unnamed protein product [Ascophyllum nodosum]